MTRHIPFGISDFLEPTILLIDVIIEDLLETDSNVCTALAKAQYNLKDAILRDELGTSDWFEPAWAIAARTMSPYVRSAVQIELSELAKAPTADCRRATLKAARNLGRWAAGGAIAEEDAKKALWNVVNSTGISDHVGRTQAIATLRTGWLQGLGLPRQAPDDNEVTHG